jgi:pimeloyl-ACP methyl ester carboxylesterase
MSGKADYVFLHGGGQGGWVWDETLAALDRQTGGRFGQALALDAPGCGAKRDRDVEAMTMQDVARELVADIEAAGLKDVVLVGHSQAGQAIPFMIRLRPGLFRRVVHVSCSLPLPGQSVHDLMGQSRHGENETEVGWPFDPKVMDYAEGFPLMFCNDMAPDQAARFAAKLGKDAWPPLTYTMTDWPELDAGDTPASYVLCLKDNILPARWQEIFAQRFRAGRIVRIDAGHQVMTTRPEALAEALRFEAAA